MRCFALLAVAPFVCSAVAMTQATDGLPTLRARVVRHPDPHNSTPSWKVVVMARGATDEMRPLLLGTAVENGRVTHIQPETAEVSRRHRVLFYISVEGIEGEEAVLSVYVKDQPQAVVACPLALGVVDLAYEFWEAHDAGPEAHIGAELSMPPEDAAWKPFIVPSTWEQLGVKWLRATVYLPARWRDKGLVLILGGADDADVAYLNGKEVGRGEGWNTRREYLLPPSLVHWDGDNDLLLAVDLRSDEGGFFAEPWVVAPEGYEAEPPLFPPSPPQWEQDRAPAGEVGPARPLRPIVARDGVLRYAGDGREVALWGTNYYPPTPSQWTSVGKLDEEAKLDIKEDFDDLARMGVDIIRFHVFDTEISDAEGNLVENEHLDKWDFLVKQCNDHGLYLMVTPIAVFGGRSGSRSDSFSMSIPRPAIVMWQEKWPAQVRYTRALLTRVNPYTGRRLVDEPCLALLEIVNEPDYWSFSEVRGSNPRGNWLGEQVGRKAMAGVKAEWEAYVPAPEWRTEEVFSFYRYETVRRYIDLMIETMRGAGATQPIAHNRYWHPWWDVHQGIGDSQCDAVTFIGYTNITQDFEPPIADDRNSLSMLRRWWSNQGLEACYAQKARAVYEFEPMATVKNISAYPAMAKQFRGRGAQIACQFQYDPKATAHANLAWFPHYLNLWHTPERMASYLIGGEIFRGARGLTYPTPEDNWVFPPGAVSDGKNAALLCTGDCYMQARPTDWQPLPVPDYVTRVLGVGTCPYFDYEGTGIVDMRIEDGVMHLRIYPDVERLRYALHGTDEEPLTQLVEREHPLTLKLPGWQDAVVEKMTGERWMRVEVRNMTFTVLPGTYRLTKTR